MKWWQWFLWVFVASSLCVGTGVSQKIGDHITAGFTNSRTYLNSDVATLKPPLRLVRTIDLSGVTAARSLLAFESYLLVGDYSNPMKYSLFNRDTGVLQWTVTLSGNHGGFIFYTPAYAHDIVILGGATSGGVKAVRVSTGQTLWEDASVGETEGRSPILTGNVVIYHGRTRLVVADAASGMIKWKFEGSTARAAVSMFGERMQGPLTVEYIDGSIWEVEQKFGKP